MNILIGYDGSRVAKDAVNIGIKHAKAFKAQVHVATSMATGTESQQKEIKDAESGLDWIKEKFETDGIPCKTHLLIRGFSPGEDLVKFAEEMQVGEIIVGAKRRSRVGKLLLGSTSQYVILNAPCPVLTIK
jgi:nucleotide-binding universal stress UspA family protein